MELTGSFDVTIDFDGALQLQRRFVARFEEALLAEAEALAREEPTLKALPMTRILGTIFSARLESLGGFSILHDAPGHLEMMERLWSRVWPGCIAGDLLLHLLQDVHQRLRGGDAIWRSVPWKAGFLSISTR